MLDSAGASSPTELPPDDVVVIPASFAQRRIWFLDQLTPGAPLYVVPIAVRLPGTIDRRALQRSLQTIVERHEVLRTTFLLLNGQPMQVIAPALTLALPFEDVSRMHPPSSPAASDALAARIAAEATRPFDLSRGPLIRALLLRISATEHRLLLNLHHIICDGWSVGVLLDELFALYHAYRAGRASPLPALPLQYADWALWQQEWLAPDAHGGELETQLAYWRAQLRESPEALDLPTDHPRPAQWTSRGATLTFSLPRPLTETLNALSQREGASLFMTLLAGFKILLARYSRQDDILVGTPIANRTEAKVERLIGCFINTLALRTRLGGNPSFRELLGRVRATCLAAYAHQDLPFELLVETLHTGRDRATSPVFQVLFVLQNAPLPSTDDAEIALLPDEIDTGVAKFDLSLVLEQRPNGLAGSFEYRRDLFEPDTIQRMAGHLEVLLTAAAADPERRILQLPLLTAAEQALLATWNRTTADYPAALCPHELFEQQAARTPDAVAVVFGEQRLRYAELNARANQLAHYLRALGVGAETPVAVCVERSLEMIVAILGILKAGGAYLPLDPAYPPARRQMMLADSGASVVLTQHDLAPHRATLLPDQPATPFHIQHPTSNIITLDADWPIIARQSSANPRRVSAPENLAYIIYTSGSTGQPKGAMIRRRGLVNLVSGLRVFFDDPVVRQVGLITSISFDISVNQIFPTLLFGRTLHIIPEAVKLDARQLFGYLVEHGIHVLDAVPSFLQAQLAEIAPAMVPTALRYLLIGGEKLEPRLLAAIFAQLGSEVAVVNIYGPTETTDINLFNVLRRADLGDVVTVGHPLHNNQVYVLNEGLTPQPPGIPGEVYIAGDSLGRGYLNRRDLTAERFIPNPFADFGLGAGSDSIPNPQSPIQNGSRLYKTGDLGRWLPDGQLELLGRIDGQIKLRGFRIEPGEIEAVLAGSAALHEVVVVARADGSAGGGPPAERLVAYLVPLEGSDLPPPDVLRAALAARLPRYMVPSAFVTLPRLPRTPSGKIDRNALPAPDGARPALARPYRAPRTPTEEVLAGLWCEVLGLDQVGVDDSFFELGGHSFAAMQLISAVGSRLGRTLPIGTVFQTPTVAALAALLDADAADEHHDRLIPIRAAGAHRPIFCIHPVGGHVLCYADLARQLGPDQPIYGLAAQGLDGRTPPLDRIEAMADTYLEAINAAGHQPPLTFVGWSMGGIVAFEMARQLQRRHTAARLILLDSWATTFVAPESLDDAQLVAVFAEDWGRSIGRDLGVRAADLRGRTPDQQLAHVLRCARCAEAIGPDTDDTTIRHLLAVFQANMRATSRYRPADQYAGRITLLRAAETDDQTGADLGWSNWAASGVDVAIVSGDHYTMLREPHVRTLAETLTRYLPREVVR